MSHSQQTRQSLHRDCLHVLITLVEFPGEQTEHFEVPGGVYGKTLTATRFNTYAGKRVRPTMYDIPPDGRAHLFASEWAGPFYAVELDTYRQGYACTCEQPYYEHIRTLRGLPPISQSHHFRKIGGNHD